MATNFLKIFVFQIKGRVSVKAVSHWKRGARVNAINQGIVVTALTNDELKDSTTQVTVRWLR